MKNLSSKDIINDYLLAVRSRHASLIGRKEVLSGKAKFGIFGDGKEVAQIAMAKAFKAGDWRSGYYRDQTFMFAIGQSNIQQFFAQLYADCDIDREPASKGRQMNSHFATRYFDDKDGWKNQLEHGQSSSDISPTAGQMVRSLGLAYASKLYRNVKGLESADKFSNKGGEVSFVTIGNASTSEGLFWETLNAAGVLQVPLVVSVWDDGYGISVPNKYQTTKESISEILAGFHPSDDKPGVEIIKVDGGNYDELTKVYERVSDLARKEHRPFLIHVVNLTQPQGHSTSGSHERYKSKDRLEFEETGDCLIQMRRWILKSELATASELDDLEATVAKEVQNSKKLAWDEFQKGIQSFYNNAKESLREDESSAAGAQLIASLRPRVFTRKDLFSKLRRYRYRHGGSQKFQEWLANALEESQNDYSEYLHVSHPYSIENVKHVAMEMSENPEKVHGRVVLQRYFDGLFSKDPRVFAIGEDIGQLGGVNLVYEDLQAKHGELRITDTGIREATILGQGIGAAMRGLRPIVDIQYLDYLLYCLQGMSDDLASLHYRSAGGQVAPVIVRTKGHRLEGIWHSGSPMGMIINAIRGIHVCVPRDMTRAAGMYQTLFQANEPALVVEVLNAYRLEESVPDNLGEYSIELGVPEVLVEGTDVTIVTYGACIQVAKAACEELNNLGVSVELIDVQTLLPFDRYGMISQSIEKTNLVMFLDEDVPGGATAFMMQQVLDRDNGYRYLDGPPRCLSAKPHRPAYGSDGDYFSKPSIEDIVENTLGMIHEREPIRDFLNHS